MPARPDPYRTLGISPTATDAELRAAYRRLVQLHHPDHNNGSPESARRFEEVQDAYAEARRLRSTGARSAGSGPGARGAASRPAAGSRPAGPPPGPGHAADPDLEARLARMEQELKAARDARERAVREARRAQEQAARQARAASSADGRPRPSDEELGYFRTDDSFTKILDDFAGELSGRLSQARDSSAAQRLSDLIDELAAKLTGEKRDKP